MAKNQDVEEPNLLFFCDFPPCNGGGGAILASRLLAEYPPERITVLTSDRAIELSTPACRLKCEHILFPRKGRVGRWGWGRIKELLDWVLFPLLVLKGIRVVKRNRIQVMVTIAHGDFVLAVAIVSALTSTPFVMLVHDDWIDNMRRGPSYLRFFRPKGIFTKVARNASRIYAVSPYMQEMLKSECGVESELQMPAIGYPHINKSAYQNSNQDSLRTFRIIYAGNGFGLDCLSLLVRVLKGEKLKPYGINSTELHLYMPLSSERIGQLGWRHESVIAHGWVAQDELQAAVASADILYLPFSFQGDQRLITRTSFPAKISDYLATGKPILICAPPYSSAAQYAEQYGFAEIVKELTEEALVQGIHRIWKSKDYREQLRENARFTFERNHDITKQRESFLETVMHIAHSATTSQTSNSFEHKRTEP